MNRSAAHLLAVLALGASSFASTATARADDVDARVEALVATMSLDQKLAQLTVHVNSEAFEIDLVRRGVAANVMNFGYKDREEEALHAAWRESGNRIGMIDGLDMEYGYRTLFPVPIAQAATFDLTLNREAARLTSAEASVSGVNWTFGPMVDVSRDQRWGRGVEGAGEDVLLASCLAGARVRGARQGGQLVSIKHYVGHGFPEGGREYGPVEMGEPFLRDVVLPPFRTAIAAGAEMVMAGFNAVNGVPVVASRRLLKDVLRGDLGFTGVVVSDWEAISQLMRHRLSDDPVEITAMALNAGVDFDMSSLFYQDHMPAALARGTVKLADVDAAVRRVLKMKFAAGLDSGSRFDPVRRDRAMAALMPEARKLAVEVARRGDVLLENRGDLLPLAGHKRIAVVGGLAGEPEAAVSFGPARAQLDEVVTLRRAIEERAAKDGIATEWIEACPQSCDGAKPSDPRIAQAAARAAAADVVVVAIGEHREYIGEAMSRADLRPSPGQTALVKALAATGKPVVVLILGGRAQIVEEFREAVGAILMVWHPGSTGSIAAAEILFGDVTPSGRLPFTWPLATGQSPLSYDMPPTARPADAVDHWTNRYIDLPPTPRYPFGYGLTTSKVVYGAPTLDRREAKIGDTVTVRVPITNAGSRPVREVAQAYVRDLFASRARPGRRLAAFRAVELAPGETKVVEMAIRPIDLGFHVETGHWVVEAGDFRVFVGADATASASVDFRLTDSLDVPARDEPVLCLDRVTAE